LPVLKLFLATVEE